MLTSSLFLAVSHVRKGRVVFPDLNDVYFALIRNIVYAQSETTILEAYTWPNLLKTWQYLPPRT